MPDDDIQLSIDASVSNGGQSFADPSAVPTPQPASPSMTASELMAQQTSASNAANAASVSARLSAQAELDAVASQTVLSRGGVSFTTPGTPYAGTRYVGPAFTSNPAGILSAPTGPINVGGGMGAYDSLREAESQIRYYTSERYAGMGRGGDIGSSIFDADVKDQMISAGWIEGTPAEREPSPFRKAFSPGGQGWNTVGFAGMQIAGAAASTYAQLNRGAYLTPEQQSQAELGLAPGIGAAVGGIAGAFGGQPILGAMLGSGIGSGISTVGGATLEREQASRLSATSMSMELGNPTGSIQKFQQAIESAGVAVQQLTQGLGTLSNLAPGMTTSSVASAGGVASALGPFYNQVTDQMSGFLSSNPMLFRERQQYALAQGSFSSNELHGIEALSIFSGDTKTYNATRIQDAAQANPRASRDANMNWWDKLAYNVRHINWNPFDASGPEEDPATAVVKNAQSKLASYSPPGMTDLFAQVTASQGELAFATTQITSADARLAQAYARGESPSQIGSIISNNVATATRSLTGADRGLIAALDKTIPSLSGGARTVAYGIRNEVEQQLTSSDTSLFTAQAAQQQFQIELNESTYGLNVLNQRNQGALERSILPTTERYAGQLNRYANDQSLYLNDIQRNALRSTAINSVHSESLAADAQDVALAQNRATVSGVSVPYSIATSGNLAGSTAYGGVIRGLGDAYTAADRASRDPNLYAGERSDFARTAADVRYRELQAITGSATYAPSTETSIGIAQAQGAFQIAMNAPFMNGPQSSPFTAYRNIYEINQQQLGSVTGKINEVRGELSQPGISTDRKGALEMGLAADIQQQIQLQIQQSQMQREVLTGFASALPESSIGAPSGFSMQRIGLSALSARFLGNPAMAGSWGAGSPSVSALMHPEGLSPNVPPGGSAGGFMGMAVSHDQRNDEMVGLLRDIRDRLPKPSGSGAPQAFTQPLFTQANRTYLDSASR